MDRPFPAVPGVEVEHRFVQARGLRFHVAQAGAPDAPPLLLLHGWPQHWFTWRKVLPALAAEYRCVMPDLRGLGWSEAPPRGYEMESLADDMLGVMDAVGLQRVPVLAHDWGGWISYLLALGSPDRIERLVTLNIPPPWGGGEPDLRGLMGLWRLWYQVLLASPVGARVARNQRAMARAISADNAYPESFTDADLAQFTAALAEPGRARASVQIYRRFLLHSTPQLLRGRYADVPLTVPTLLLFGARDRAVAPRLIDRAVRPGDPMEVVRVPDSGHFIADEQPELVARRALEFFAAGA